MLHTMPSFKCLYFLYFFTEYKRHMNKHQHQLHCYKVQKISGIRMLETVSCRRDNWKVTRLTLSLNSQVDMMFITTFIKVCQ